MNDVNHNTPNEKPGVTPPHSHVSTAQFAFVIGVLLIAFIAGLILPAFRVCVVPFVLVAALALAVTLVCYLIIRDNVTAKTSGTLLGIPISLGGSLAAFFIFFWIINSVAEKQMSGDFNSCKSPDGNQGLEIRPPATDWFPVDRNDLRPLSVKIRAGASPSVVVARKAGDAFGETWLSLAKKPDGNWLEVSPVGRPDFVIGRLSNAQLLDHGLFQRVRFSKLVFFTRRAVNGRGPNATPYSLGDYPFSVGALSVDENGYVTIQLLAKDNLERLVFNDPLPNKAGRVFRYDGVNYAIAVLEIVDKPEYGVRFALMQLEPY